MNNPNFGFDWYAGENYETSYSEPFNYNNLILDGKRSLEKEYYPFFKYLQIGKFAYVKGSTNSGKSGLQINDFEYFTPCFLGFAKDEAGVNKTYESEFELYHIL